MRRFIEYKRVILGGSKRTISGLLTGLFLVAAVTISGLGASPVLAAAAPPTNVKTLTGGDSIAVVWDLSPGTIKNYEVYRDGSKIATVTPGQGVLNLDKKGNNYIDKTVTSGIAYQYSVRAVAPDDSTSTFATAPSVTQPAPGSTTPVPTITIDVTAAPDLANYLQTQIKPALEAWYPKLGNAVAYPTYTPISSFTLIADPNVQSGSIATGNYMTRTIRFLPTYVRNNPADSGGMFVHEAFHILQAMPNYNSTNSWLAEGEADWTRDFFTRERSTRLPKPTDKYTDGYSVTAYFFQWIQNTYDSNFIRKLNITLHNGTYDPSVFTTNTGKTLDQLWTEMRNKHFASPAPIVGIAGKCVNLPNNAASNGALMQLATCDGTEAQQWVPYFKDITTGNPASGFSIQGNAPTGTNNWCLDVKNSGTADGTPIWLYGCNGTTAQAWTLGANGGIVNTNSNKCLATTGGGSQDGNQLIISTCNGSASQNWKIQMTSSAIDERYGSDQAMRVALGTPIGTGTEVTDGIYKYRNYAVGRAYYTTRSGVHYVVGSVLARFNGLGAHTNLGEPTTDTLANGNDRYNDFYGTPGTMTTTIYSTPGYGAKVVFGSIRQQWVAVGRQAGVLGYPKSDEQTTPNGRARYNNFQNGGIYANATTGTNSVNGAIYTKWGSFGWEGGFLGLPTTSEKTTPSGIGRYNHFEGGSIYWSPSTGAWSVKGAIRDRWAALGWEQSYLGYPTSDEFDIAGGKRTNFQNGYITWTASNGQVTDRHY